MKKLNGIKPLKKSLGHCVQRLAGKNSAGLMAMSARTCKEDNKNKLSFKMQIKQGIVFTSVLGAVPLAKLILFWDQANLRPFQQLIQIFDV